jgi:hypothetical protein
MTFDLINFRYAGMLKILILISPIIFIGEHAVKDIGMPGIGLFSLLS